MTERKQNTALTDAQLGALLEGLQQEGWAPLGHMFGQAGIELGPKVAKILAGRVRVLLAQSRFSRAQLSFALAAAEGREEDVLGSGELIESLLRILDVTGKTQAHTPSELAEALPSNLRTAASQAIERRARAGGLPATVGVLAGKRAVLLFLMEHVVGRDRVGEAFAQVSTSALFAQPSAAAAGASATDAAVEVAPPPSTRALAPEAVGAGEGAGAAKPPPAEEGLTAAPQALTDEATAEVPPPPTGPDATAADAAAGDSSAPAALSATSGRPSMTPESLGGAAASVEPASAGGAAAEGPVEPGSVELASAEPPLVSRSEPVGPLAGAEAEASLPGTLRPPAAAGFEVSAVASPEDALPVHAEEVSDLAGAPTEPPPPAEEAASSAADELFAHGAPEAVEPSSDAGVQAAVSPPAVSTASPPASVGSPAFIPDFAARFERAYQRLREERGANRVKLSQLRQSLADFPSDHFDRELRKLREQQRYELQGFDGMQGELSDADRRAAITETGHTFVYVARRDLD